MNTLKRISDITGYSEAYITGKEYKGDIKNVRLAAIWILKDEFDVTELGIIFNRKNQKITKLLDNAQDLLDVRDARLTYLLEQLYQTKKRGLKNALKQAVSSWDKSVSFNMWLFSKGMEYQSKQKI